MHVMFMTNVHSDVIKANRPSGIAFFKISKITADTDFANSALFSFNAIGGTYSPNAKISLWHSFLFSMTEQTTAHQ